MSPCATSLVCSISRAMINFIWDKAEVQYISRFSSRYRNEPTIYIMVLMAQKLAFDWPVVVLMYLV